MNSIGVPLYVVGCIIAIASWGLKTLYQDMKSRLKETTDSFSKSLHVNTRSLDKVSDTLQRAVTKMEVLSVNLNNVETSVEEMKQELEYQSESQTAVVHALKTLHAGAKAAGWAVPENLEFPQKVFKR